MLRISKRLTPFPEIYIIKLVLCMLVAPARRGSRVTYTLTSFSRVVNNPSVCVFEPISVISDWFPIYAVDRLVGIHVFKMTRLLVASVRIIFRVSVLGDWLIRVGSRKGLFIWPAFFPWKGGCFLKLWTVLSGARLSFTMADVSMEVPTRWYAVCRFLGLCIHWSIGNFPP